MKTWIEIAQVKQNTDINDEVSITSIEGYKKDRAMHT